MNDDLLRPPPPPPILKHLPLAVDPKQFPPPAPSSSPSISLGWTLLIITAILGFSFLACLFIRLVLRLRRSYSAVASASFLDLNQPSGPAAADDGDPSEKKLNSLGPALSALSKSSPDCAVCLRSFRPDEDLRLLPACSHSFHAGCVDTWIQNSPSCPLCRAPVTLPPPPLLSAALPPPVKMTSSGVQARSFPEGESIRNISLPSPLASPPRRLLYSICDETMEEDIEEALARIVMRSDSGGSSARMPSSPGDEVAAATAGGEPTRWLRDCIDRQLSSRSSSFFPYASSSFQYSGRWAVHQEDFGGSGRYPTDREEAGNGICWWSIGV
ncbi:uncharacterized protein LOC141837855 [Curcuma longa]|uniref:uncharacterized protein LOC141837855 n=1 Tax=Curcuma longa TaxID=136217 RepID=UPI003D9ECB81